jgi:FKBP-type peptidyl-prolyl cis-trans isomerase
MKKILITCLISAAAVTAAAQKKAVNPAKATPKKLSAPVKINPSAIKNSLDSASYAFGHIMATNLKQSGISTLNYDLMVKGLKDAFTNQTALLNADQSQSAINTIFQEGSRKQYDASIAAGKAFFENNKKVAGVQTTASGLQYQVLKGGTGEKPKPTSKVKVHYKGTLLNGKQFDSSYDRGEPTSFEVGSVIAGWTEGLQLMQKGAKYKFFVPFNLAYGERAPGPEIPAYSNLIFEIELLEIDGK